MRGTVRRGSLLGSAAVFFLLFLSGIAAAKLPKDLSDPDLGLGPTHMCVHRDPRDPFTATLYELIWGRHRYWTPWCPAEELPTPPPEVTALPGQAQGVAWDAVGVGVETARGAPGAAAAYLAFLQEAVPEAPPIEPPALVAPALSLPLAPADVDEPTLPGLPEVPRPDLDPAPDAAPEPEPAPALAPTVASDPQLATDPVPSPEGLTIRFPAPAAAHAPRETPPGPRTVPAAPARETVGPALAVASAGRAGVPFAPFFVESPLEVRLAVLVAFIGALLLPYVLLYRRIERADLLDHERRARVLEHVKARPGATAAEVARALGVHYTTAQHHLDILAEFGAIVKREEAGHVRYFENHGKYTPEEQRILSQVASGPAADFLRLVAASPGLTQREAAVRLSLAESTLSWRVRALKDAGLVTKEGRALRLTPAGAKALVLLASVTRV